MQTKPSLRARDKEAPANPTSPRLRSGTEMSRAKGAPPKPGGAGTRGGKGGKVVGGKAAAPKGEADKSDPAKPKKARSAYNFYLLKRIAQVRATSLVGVCDNEGFLVSRVLVFARSCGADGSSVFSDAKDRHLVVVPCLSPRPTCDDRQRRDGLCLVYGTRRDAVCTTPSHAIVASPAPSCAWRETRCAGDPKTVAHQISWAFLRPNIVGSDPALMRSPNVSYNTTSTNCFNLYHNH